MRTLTDIIKTVKPGEGPIYYPLTAGSLPPGKSSGSRARSRALASDAIDLQAQSGIHIPSTGEPTSSNNGSMEIGFYQAFDGISIVNGEASGTGELKVKSAEELNKLDIIAEVGQAKEAIDTLTQAGKYREFLALKASLTGPGHLARSLSYGVTSVDALMGRFAEGLVEIARHMYDKGARVFQIDEPKFTMGPLHRKETVRAIQALVSQMRLQLPELLFVSLHVCGDHSPETLDHLERVDVDLLDVEFSSHEGNYDVVQNGWLWRNEKNVGIGVVSGDIPYTEDDATIASAVERIIRTYDPRLVMLKPDCQLRLLPWNAAAQKLGMVQRARQLALSRFSGHT